MRPLASAVLAALLLAAAGRGQPAANPDRVFVRDKANRDGPPKAVEGELKATAGGYQVVSGGKTTAVSPADIVRVVPGDLPGLDRKDVTGPAALEEKREWAKANAEYAGQLAKLTGAADKTRRFLQFKAAYTAARAADDTADDAGWKGKAEDAAKQLADYGAAYRDGWEAWPAGRTAARLWLELGDAGKAAEAWGRLARAEGVPPDLKAEAGLQEVEAFIRAKDYSRAAGRAGDLEASTPAGLPKDRLAILRLAAKAGENPATGAEQLEGEVTKAKEPAVRATGRLAQAELYLAADKPREAMWALLWVEVVDNQDRHEAAKAAARLADVFRVLGDEEKARAYRDRLRRARAGL